MYRRWASKPELVRAAVVRGTRGPAVPAPDTGTLRDDLLTYLHQANERRAHLAVVLAARLGEYFAATDSSLADLRESMLAGRGTTLDTVLERAVRRGEIDPEKLTPRVAQLPFDLLRHELLMTYKPVPDEVLESIVDEVFLPLVRPER